MKSTLAPMNVANMSKKEKEEKIELLMFLKKRRNGTVKRQSCVDGQKQREGSQKKYATYPTVAL